MKVANMMIFVFDRVENIVGKGENAGYQHFLLFPQCFQEAFYSGVLKVGIVWERVKLLHFLRKFQFKTRSRCIRDIDAPVTCSFEVSTQLQPLSNTALRVRWECSLNVIHLDSAGIVFTFGKKTINEHLKQNKNNEGEMSMTDCWKS